MQNKIKFHAICRSHIYCNFNIIWLSWNLADSCNMYNSNNYLYTNWQRQCKSIYWIYMYTRKMLQNISNELTIVQRIIEVWSYISRVCVQLFIKAWIQISKPQLLKVLIHIYISTFFFSPIIFLFFHQLCVFQLHTKPESSCISTLEIWLRNVLRCVFRMSIIQQTEYRDFKMSKLQCMMRNN